MRTGIKLKSLFFSILLLTATSYSAVRLPKLVGDGMVLQRDAKVKIWGWATAGEKITVHFIESTLQTTADQNGDWQVLLAEKPAGGPYTMQIEASNSITIDDILIGDVWVCSGQSNMGVAMGWLTTVYPKEIANSENKFIRQFNVPVTMNFQEREKDFKYGQWQSANPKNLRSFTAVGYFFAQKLYETYKIPIGIIHASLGGSSAEAWISEESLKEFPKYYEDAQSFKTPGYIERINKQDDARVKSWNQLLRQNDAGLKDPHTTWYDPELDTSAWENMSLPGYWDESKPAPVNGVYWFRKQIAVPAEMTGKQALLKLGRIVDCDSVFINGKFIGTTGSQYAPRAYKIPDNLLTEGDNTLVIRVINYIRHGGFVPGKQYELAAGETTINLAGEWQYRVGTIMEPLQDRLFTGKIPTGLFNGMLAPMLNYSIKGAVWYQGESNTSRAFEHYDLFKLLIQDWRTNWRQGNFPFLYVQLPNFVEVNTELTRYDWAYFRESQLKALAIPNTGMAVTIDIGEYNDIHPANKKDVGYRLALAAHKVAYSEKQIVYSGPIYKAIKIKGNKVILAFTNVGGGLVAKNGNELKRFEICGSDNKYYPAQAQIEKDKVIVWCDNVARPVAARYAWANNPEGANLYNQEGLPASPFRTCELY
ncbi:MAG TPA: sialate O-acetylesterase [bacterium]|nr:sialate O-acetylesterase [bacterium]HPN42027.1 sialate O-acetylesterase [bacterium]